MLRSTRSLPSLKAQLSQTVRKEVEAQSRQFSQVSSRYRLAVPDIPNNGQRLNPYPYSELKRHVHQTTKNGSTTLLSSSNKSEFSMMSLNTLKMECRKRGLKVSGRKTELVSRIQTYESSYSTSQGNAMSTFAAKKQPSSSRPSIEMKKLFEEKQGAGAGAFSSIDKKKFSKSAAVEKKGDDSHIDYIKPIDPIEPKLVGDDYIVQIPSISTEASQTPVTKLEKILKEVKDKDVNINEQIVVKADGSDSTIFESGSLEKVEDQNAEALKLKTEEVFGEDVTDGGAEQGSYKYDDAKIPQNDKRLFAGFFAAVGAWWLIKPKSKK